MSVKVTNEVDTYDDPATASIRVHSHWCFNDRVVLEVDGKQVTVVARQLKAAIDNATNTAKY